MYRYIETKNVSKEEYRTQPLKLLWIVLCLRSGLFLAELITGLRVHSLSLIALSGHLFVDLSAIAIALVAAWLVKHSARNKLLLNPQQIEALAALVNSLILLYKTYPKLDKLDWCLLSASLETVGSTSSTDLEAVKPTAISK